MEGLLVLFFAVVAIFVAVKLTVVLQAFGRFRRKRLRRVVMATAAQELGLSYESRHPIAGVPFSYRMKGNGSGADNFLTGERDGMAVILFDAWYYVNLGEGRMPLRRYTWLTCAVTELPVDWPHLTIEPETTASRLADRMGMPDLQFESEQFNRMFEVRAAGPVIAHKLVNAGIGMMGRMKGFQEALELAKRDDPRLAAMVSHSPAEQKRFVSALIDARMMDWLLSTRAEYSFETLGPYLLCYQATGTTSQLEPLIEALRGFRDRIPTVAWELFGPGRDAAPTAPSAETPEERHLMPPRAEPVQPALFDDGASPARALDLISPDELPLKPGDPRLASLREHYGDEALKIAGLI